MADASCEDAFEWLTHAAKTSMHEWLTHSAKTSMYVWLTHTAKTPHPSAHKVWLYAHKIPRLQEELKAENLLSWQP